MKRRIVLAAFAISLALASCEVMARVVFPAPPNPMRQPPIVYRSDSELRYVLSPNQQGWVDDGFVTTNSRGFRGREVALPKPQGRYRIVLIGDSVTFGWGVNDDQTFAVQLERQLAGKIADRDVEVVNLAVGGYNTHQEVAWLRRNVEALRPDLVLVGFYSNDVPDALDDQSAADTDRTEQAAQPSGNVLHLNPAPKSFFERQMRRSRMLFMLGRVAKRVMNRGDWGTSRFQMELDLLKGSDSPELETAWGRIAIEFDRLRAIAGAGGFPVGVVALPPREQVQGVYASSAFVKRLHNVAEQRGFFVIDPRDAMAKSTANVVSLYIAYDRNHPSALGHRILAQAIADDLMQREQFRSARHIAGNESGQ